MPRATLATGDLIEIRDCYIHIEMGAGVEIPMKIVPEISDSKSATYPDENAIGRSFPFKNYSYSDNRTISWTAHFMVCKEGDQATLYQYLRAIEACVYPKTQDTNGAPYNPPPLCKLRCGQLLDRDADLCCVMKSYSVKYDTSIPWDEDGFMPYRLDIDMQFEVVVDNSQLPGAEQILALGE
jgi:hypothetical protein